MKAKSIYITLLTLGLASSFQACNKYLDIAPDDGVATEDMAFHLRDKAIKYLYSCYSYIPNEVLITSPNFTGSDEYYIAPGQLGPAQFGAAYYINSGLQNVSSPYDNNYGNLYSGIRYCNTLIDRIDEVLNMEEWEKKKWTAEAKVIKAYLLYSLVRKYGPVYIPRKNLLVDASVSEVQFYRNNIDECFDYMFELIDEAMPDLDDIEVDYTEYGRINKLVAAGMKAKMAVSAARPLFNNNKDQASLVDNKGRRLFPEKSESEANARWQYAMKACSEAIDICRQAGRQLYYYRGNLAGKLDPILVQELNIREAICDNWNEEVVWSHSKEYGSYNNYIRYMAALNLSPDNAICAQRWIGASVPFHIVDMFYTKHGVPIENDVTRMNVDMYGKDRTVTDSYDERWLMIEGHKTKEIVFEREPRFYADLWFDGSLSMYNDINLSPETMYTIVRARGCLKSSDGSNCGFLCKKIIKYDTRDINTSSTGYSASPYSFPTLRLADLYLLYAESINECEGPFGEHSSELFNYVDSVRVRAGIPTVKMAWDNYSNAPGKYSTKEGMREIIHRERLIELAFEGQRFWDLRQWKEAPAEYAKDVYGWDGDNYNNYDRYYTRTLYRRNNFSTKDYFWPFATSTLERNPNLVQNLGW